jgi:hypothetical protein
LQAIQHTLLAPCAFHGTPKSGRPSALLCSPVGRPSCAPGVGSVPRPRNISWRTLPEGLADMWAPATRLIKQVFCRNRFCKQSNILCWHHAHSMAHPNLVAHQLCCAHLSVALAAHQVLARFLGLATYLGARSQKVLQTWGRPPHDLSNKLFAGHDLLLAQSAGASLAANMQLRSQLGGPNHSVNHRECRGPCPHEVIFRADAFANAFAIRLFTGRFPLKLRNFGFMK